MSEAKKRFHPMQGKKHTAETRLKISLAQKGKARPKQSGANSSFWKGGTTSKMKIARQSVEYRNWRDALFARDDYTCQACGARGGELSPDHVMPMSLYPEMQFDVLNGRTLCRECHKNTETFGCKIRQFEPEMKFLLALTNPAIV